MAQGVVFGGKNSGAGSVFKSIQRGKTYLPANSPNTTLDIPITSVDMNKSIVQCKMVEAGSNNNDYGTSMCFVAGNLTSPTNLRLSRYSWGGYGYVVWEVIEFDKIKSLQSGAVGTSNLVDVITVNQVTVEKSKLFINYKQAGGNAFAYTTLIEGRIINSTTINIEKFNINSVVNWYLVEFN